MGLAIFPLSLWKETSSPSYPDSQVPMRPASGPTTRSPCGNLLRAQSLAIVLSSYERARDTLTGEPESRSRRAKSNACGQASRARGHAEPQFRMTLTDEEAIKIVS